MLPGAVAMILTVAFVVVAVLLCVAALLVILGTANVYLSGPEAIERDGLARGRRAPRWSLPDESGAMHTSPPTGSLQLVLFADHSLKSFPSVISGVRELIAGDPGLATVVLLSKRNDLVGAVLAMNGLAGLPVLTGSAALYADYNVRVGPFAIFVDSAGLVRASSLVNHDWQVAKLRQVAGLEISADERAAARRRWPHRGLARTAV